MESLEPMASFWRGRKVLITGATGFKGAWLSLWLLELGAQVFGYSLEAEHGSLFEVCKLQSRMRSMTGDIRDRYAYQGIISELQPEVVFHLAAQPLVGRSFEEPYETFSVNVMGTANVLDCARDSSVRSLVIVTTDKCYENREWVWGYRETDTLGGYDPYSSSKACAELVAGSYRQSFFAQAGKVVGVATARAGNVIGGGDWAADRLVPDLLRAMMSGDPLVLRHSESIRPWQHVLEPLRGYLLLAERLYESPQEYEGAWNFGPDVNGCQSVSHVVNSLVERIGRPLRVVEETGAFHETRTLLLDCAKARTQLGWTPRWTLDEALGSIAEWFEIYLQHGDLTEACSSQIRRFTLGSGPHV